MAGTENIGIEQEIIDRIINMYERIYSKVKTPVQDSENFIIKTGLRQGGVLSPLLFIIVMDKIQ